MAAAPDAIRRWAAAHAATVHGTGPRLERGQPPGPQATPTVIAAVSEPRFWTTGSPAFGVSATATPDGQVLLAVGERDGSVGTWDAETGQLQRRLTGHGAALVHQLTGSRSDWSQLSWGRLTDGTTVLTGPSSPAHAHTVWCAAWGEDPDGRPELATGSGDGGIHFWDPGTGQHLRTIHTPHGIIYTLAWAPGGRRHSVLVSAGQDQTVRVWDPVDGTELYPQPADSPLLRAADLVRHPNGDLLLVLAEDGETGQGSPPFSVRRLATRTAGRPTGHPSGQPASRPAGRTRLTAQLARELPAWLLRLDRGDLWPPLGLVADLVAVTGPAVPAADAAPPADRVRAEALAHAPRGQADDAGQPPWTPGVAGLRAAAAAVTDQAVALLLILGPGACAADPLLPLRLAQYVTRLPPLAPRELRLIASVTSEYAAAGQAAAGTLTYSPGTAGLARSGPPARLLPTQLALPRDLLTVRLAEDQLLYRQHRGPAPPAPRPVTIILDTPPPTFGPAGNTLRTAAHLIARTLWSHGRQPALITLDRPESITELRSPADLMRIWASATLDGPGEPLAVALRTAVSLGQPALFCTHYRTARDHYRAGRATRLLTTHQPPEAPPLRPAGPWHAHLPPDPGGPELARAVAALLGSHATAGEPA